MKIRLNQTRLVKVNDYSERFGKLTIQALVLRPSK